MSDVYSPIAIRSIPDIIYENLRRDISHGVYPPGRISIRQLASRFAVSAMPVREALRRLEAEGLVSFDAGRQVRVNALDPGDVAEIFAIRIELESLALRQGVPSLCEDADALERLEELNNTMNELNRAMSEDQLNPDQWRLTNQDFHFLMYEAAGMARLQGMITALWVAVEPYLRLYASSVDSFRVAQEQHREIIDCVRAGDAEGAQAALREHLEVTLDVLLKQFTIADAADGSGAGEE